MPESKKRKKAAYTPPPPAGGVKKKGPSPAWVPALMVALFVIGILWLVLFYLLENDMPLVGGLHQANLLVGFGFIIAGFMLATQWR